MALSWGKTSLIRRFDNRVIVNHSAFPIHMSCYRIKNNGYSVLQAVISVVMSFIIVTGVSFGLRAAGMYRPAFLPER